MRESFGIRIALTDGSFARVWNGVGDLPVPADAIETDPVVYLGAGELISAPDFQQLLNGTAERLSLGVSGVTPATVSFAREEAAAIKGAQVQLVRFAFDDAWQLASVEYEATFRADSLATANQPTDTGRTRSITLSIGTENTDRSLAPVAFWTAADQHRRSPTDQFFDHVAGITSGTSRRFGPSS